MSFNTELKEHIDSIKIKIEELANRIDTLTNEMNLLKEKFGEDSFKWIDSRFIENPGDMYFDEYWILKKINSLIKYIEENPSEKERIAKKANDCMKHVSIVTRSLSSADITRQNFAKLFGKSRDQIHEKEMDLLVQESSDFYEEYLDDIPNLDTNKILEQLNRTRRSLEQRFEEWKR